MNAIRKTVPHAILAAAIMAAGATAVIVINVGLLDYASGSVGSLSPRTPRAKQKPRPAVKLHGAKPRPNGQTKARVKRKRTVVHTAAPVVKAAPQPVQSSPTAAPSPSAAKAAPNKGSTSTQTKTKPPPATTTTSESEDGQTHHRRSREHEDEHEHEPGDD